MNPTPIPVVAQTYHSPIYFKTPKRARMIDDDHHHGEAGLRSVCIKNIKIG